MKASTPLNLQRGCLLLLACVPWTELGAFETLGARWPGGRAPFRINPNFPDTLLSGTPLQQEEIILCAAAAWSDQSSSRFAFQYQGLTTTARLSERDGVNAVFWSNADGGEALAATVFTGTETGVATSFDIIFFDSSDGAPNRWSGPGEPSAGEFDLGGVATHELGHALGLDHTPISGATMFASASGRALGMRTLHADDRSGVEFLYGTDAEGPGVQILAAMPDNGPTSGGNEVLLEGVNFTYDSDSQLFVGGTALSSSRWDVESCDRIRIHDMPSHSVGPVSIRVANTIGSVTLDAAYRYGGPAPRLLAIEPPAGPSEGGITVLITGENLAADAVVSIGGLPLESAQFLDPGTIQGVIPASAAEGPVDVRLQQGGDEFVLEDAFTYNPYELALGEGSGAPGAMGVGVPVLVTSPRGLGSVSFGCIYDGALLAVQEVSTAGTAAENAEFAAADIDNQAGVTTFGMVMSFGVAGAIFPAGSESPLASILADLSVAAVAGETIPIVLADGAGQPPIELIFALPGDAERLHPLTRDGSVHVRAGALFVRGDANDSDRVDISDAVFHLNFLFQGGPASRCRDAADSNDDGRLDISDSLATLNALFQDGRPLKPPFPSPGIDPTPDALPCEEAPPP